MKIIILVIGSTGDVAPMVALGRGLAARGHEVTLASYAFFSKLSTEHGLKFVELPGDLLALMKAPASRKLVAATGTNPIRYFYALAKHVRSISPAIRPFLDRCKEICQKADLLVYSLTTQFCAALADYYNIPAVQAYVHPFTSTSAFPSPLANLKFPKGALFNRLSHIIAEQVMWQPYRPILNRWRWEDLGLSPIKLLDNIFQCANRSGTPTLYAYSPAVLPKPPDWNERIYVTGYWHLPTSRNWTPPIQLTDFLRAGPPPIYVGFGSMMHFDPSRLSDMIVEALAKTGNRGIVYTGWGGVVDRSLPSCCLRIENYVPHEWLFPKVKMVIHHGGAGTTGAVLRAGVPSIVHPSLGDQFFWGDRCFELGVGPRPIRRLTTSELTRAIIAAQSSPKMLQNSRELASRIRIEDGIDVASKAILEYAGRAGCSAA